ncbi:MAG: hypothetical protein JWP35_2530 [Caulobacter sp.]|nr:hypothetical protein [Caulobacter sp.]
MHNENTAALLLATAEAWVEKHRDRLGALPGATGDIINRMLEIGVLERAPNGSLRSKAGGSPDDLAETVRREAPHLFLGPDDAAGAPVEPHPKPNGPRPSATARLSVANGHPPIIADKVVAR